MQLREQTNSNQNQKEITVMNDLRQAIHNVYAGLDDEGEYVGGTGRDVYHADVCNTSLIVDQLVAQGTLVVPPLP